MEDWQTYRLTDFIPFTPDVYWRLLERVNEAYWPLQFAAIALGIAALCLALLGKPRGVLVLLAPLWLASGIGFHHRFYAELNWAATWFGWVFIIQAALLIVLATFVRRPLPPRLGVIRLGAVIAIGALLVYPLLAGKFGQGFSHAEILGLHPDPTAIASLGLLLMVLRGPAAWLAFAIPLLWCLIGALTLIALKSDWALLPLAAAALSAGALAVAGYGRVKSGRSRSPK
ncbi:MAG: DUF6064 family protein [Sphingomonadales bacterium]